MTDRQTIRATILEFVLHNGAVTYLQLLDYLRSKDLIHNPNTLNFHLSQMKTNKLLRVNEGNELVLGEL